MDNTGLPKLHDYRSQKWGYAISIFDSKDGGKTASALGFGRGISVNDLLLMTDKTGTGLYFYRAAAVEYFRDPSDMWQIDLEFLPLTGTFHSVDECIQAALVAVLAVS